MLLRILTKKARNSFELRKKNSPSFERLCFCSCLMIEQLQNERLRIPYSAAVDEGTKFICG